MQYLSAVKSTTQPQARGSFHTHVKVRVLLIVEDPTLTVICRTAISTLPLPGFVSKVG